MTDMDTKDTLHFLTKKDGSRLAYRLEKRGEDAPFLVFLSGYRSDMTGTKATYLSEYCAQKNHSFLRFDYRGHGESSGEFSSLCLGDWLDDTLTIIDALTNKPLIIIGSSMGGWLGLLLAKHRADRVQHFIGIAAAPDFTDWVWNNEMTEEQRALCQKQGYIDTPEGDSLSLLLFEDGKNHLVLNAPLPLRSAVTLLHGKQDKEVPWAISQMIAAHIRQSTLDEISPRVISIDDGDHRLSRPEDLTLLGETLDSLLKKD